jgi:hypothetical protein
LPSREEVASKLRGLIGDTTPREEVASWASTWVTSDEFPVDDERVWEALKNLAMADLISTDRPYLYGKEDFQDWLAELLK